MNMQGLKSTGLGLLLALGIHTAAGAADARLILVGDSTIAPNGGYGNELCAYFKPSLDCINVAKGGRSSGSFRAEGLWEPVLQKLRDAKGMPTIVMIQFGHNDQPGKPGRSTDLVKEYPQNLARYVQEVRELGGQAVLVTPLTRRSFKGPYLRNDLAPWSGATRRVASELKVPMVDLNALSIAAVEAMGEQEADTLAPAPAPDPKFDRTHLGKKGADVFSAIVAKELRRAAPALVPHYKN
jgi:lysophospholipase L1-like esterase